MILLGSDGLTDYIQPKDIVDRLVIKLKQKASQDLICREIAETAQNEQISQNI